ncbi:MAG TPA: DUF6600 domain-containing protein [Myxococcota bacterium]|nr:DUF6600 domain-containing protein [Myxococcota bacterium]
MSFEFFHSTLAPYGNWHVSASYGRVWIPHMHVIEWHPYADGHWVYSDLGWAWVSDYEWGAIPYHYGTWALDPELGWVWVPGYVWAPSWVVFRTGPSYVGWAPVPPSFSVGVSFEFGDYAPDHFVFVREADFLAPEVHRYAVPIERTRAIYNDTRVVNRIRIENDVVVNRGLDVQRFERVARAPLPREPIERVPRVAPGDRVTREDLRVDPRRIDRGSVRAAAPAPAEGVPAPERAPSEVRHGRDRGPAIEQPREPEPVFEQPSEPHAPAARHSRERAPAAEQPAPPRQRGPAVEYPREHEPAAERPREGRGGEPGPTGTGPEPEHPREAPGAGPDREPHPAGPPPHRGRGGPPHQEEPPPQGDQQDQHDGGHGQRG